MKRSAGCLLVLLLAACGQGSTSASQSPGETPSPVATATPHVADWAQYHGGAGRAGVGPAAPALANPRKAWTAPVDGEIYASPLIVGGRVFVATENNTVYSLSLDTGALVWKSHLGTPVNAGSLPCGNIRPVTGITGTPAADAASGKLYVVAFVSGFHHLLFTLNLSDGAVLQQQVIDPPGSAPAVEQERGALTIASGYVYVPLGGLYGDCGNYHGYVVAVPEAGGTMLSYRTPSSRESGIWSPMGATVSQSGSLYVVTGNGSSTSSFDYSNSVVQLSADLKVQGYFAPSNWRALDDSDTDLGSVGVALLPDLGLLVSIGKAGVAYLLREGRLGGVGGQVAARRVCSGAWGGSAWAGTVVFLPCADGLVALSVSSSSLSVAWHAGGVHEASPIVTAGAVWAIDVSSATLFALDLGSGSVRYQLGLGAAQHFSTPAATDGYVVAPAGSSVVAVITAP